MSDEIGFSRSGGGMFEMERTVNGQTVIYRTDNATVFIRQNIENHIAAYGLAEQVKAKVEDAGEGWTRVEIAYSADLD